ncbi:hypothetical protein HDA32_003832 [Spinactinospora alkalitolerans]|uniref:DUF485 domain-containing protein n=1 Tax=Spinactinospora alkalitolerans TaxID=687207 RepID=A0A852U060_9ACTN|nr:hypothetical protein [Spinactinospora alkalitolerans]NYE48712.1 hypothetical protein [Spinactinospora alkalitolerans]
MNRRPVPPGGAAPPRRTVVVGPATQRAMRAGAPVPARADRVPDCTRLMRRQLSLGLALVAVVALVLLVLPMVFTLRPSLSGACSGGLRPGWIAVAVGLPPLAVLAMMAHVSAVERLERRAAFRADGAAHPDPAEPEDRR